jgi:hypothetical protein
MQNSFITLSELRRNLGAAVDHVSHIPYRLPILKHGHFIAALVPYSDYLALEQVRHKSQNYHLDQSAEKLREFAALKQALSVVSAGQESQYDRC